MRSLGTEFSEQAGMEANHSETGKEGPWVEVAEKMLSGDRESCVARGLSSLGRCQQLRTLHFFSDQDVSTSGVHSGCHNPVACSKAVANYQSAHLFLFPSLSFTAWEPAP